MISFNPFDRREKFFILLVTPEKVSAVLFGVTRDRSISCEKFWPEFALSQSHRWLTKVLPHWTVIVAVSPHLAYTADIPIHLSREETYKEELSLSELDSLLGRVMNQEFMANRKIAGRALQVSELEIVLADSRIRDFRVDGHHVHNPMGFKAKHIEASIEMTFVRREVYESLRGFSNRSHFFFTGLDRSILAALRKNYEPPFVCTLLESPRSSVFRISSSHGNRIERYEIDWSAKSFLQVFMDEWGVNEESARELLRWYREGKLPQSAEQIIKKEFQKLAEHLEKELGGHLGKMPILISSQEMIMPLSRKINLEKITLRPVFEKMGFTAKEQSWPMAEHERFSYCAPLLEFYSHQGSPEINLWLRRRLHWLGSMNYT